MARRFSKCFGALVLIAGTTLAVHTTAGAQTPPSGPVGDRLPSIVTQVVAQLTGPQRFARDPQATAALSNPAVHVDPAGRIQLAFHTDHPVTAAEAASLAALGATNATAPALRLPNVGIVQAWVPAASVAAAAALPWVKAVTTPGYGAVDVGSVTSQGVVFHQADVAQAAGVNGAGVKVGAVSDGVTNLAASVALGDLPNNVNVLDAGSGDEGTAMLEIIHDMAPGASLLFDGTGDTLADHVAALNNLAANGANVIAEDIAFDDEPAFQQGLTTRTAENIAAGGVSVHSSAGNLGQKHAARVTATGTGQRPDGTANSFTGCAKTPDNVVDIDPGAGTAFDVTLGAGGQLLVTLQWSEPRAIFPTLGQGGFTDLNLYIMNAGLTQCLAQATAVQANGQGDTMEQAFVTVGGSATTLKLVVDVESTSTAVAAPTIDLRWRNFGAGLTPVDTPTRAGSLNPDSNYTGLATSSAAINATSGAIESFSAGGPVQLGLTTVCPGGAAGPCTGVSGGGSTGAVAPTWGAADGVSVTGVGGFPTTFFGTSAAAPHAAACDALARQFQPAMNATLAVALLKAGAVDQPPAGVDNITGVGKLICSGQSPAIVCASPPAPGTLPGNNIVIASAGQVTIGTAGADIIYGTSGDDRIAGMGGDDIIFAGGGNDWVTGGDGKDTLCGDDGNDRLTGDAGNDLVVGGTGNDDLAGVTGDDRIIGGTGLVHIDGGDGTDTCTPGTGVGSATVRCETIVP